MTGAAGRSGTGRPTLAVVTMVSDVGARFEPWLERALEVADELVIFVDARSADETLATARSVADTVVVFEHPGTNEGVMDACAHAATSDWVLFLDDDELLHRGFPAAVAPLLEDRRLTHYWQPYRWILANGDTYAWVGDFPWHPNPRLRLIRNVASLYWHRGRPHSPFEVQGEGRLVEGDELAIWHTDFVLRDRAAREAKVARYRERPGPSCEEYYLWEDAAPLTLNPFDAGAVLRDPTAKGHRRATERRARPPAPTTRVGAHALAAIAARHRPDADVFGAEYRPGDGVARLRANQGANLRVTVTNTSGCTWRVTGTEPGRVVLSHHWQLAGGFEVVRNGEVTMLPHEIEPGEQVSVEAGVWAPYEPGSYQLVWDLRAEGVNWFSERGVASCPVAVEVLPQGRRLARPRPAAEPPARTARPAPGGLVPTGMRWARAFADAARSRATIRASNLQPLAPERLLDTRDGTGVPGAPCGPIQAGAEVTLVVAGQAGIPDTATGIVGTVSVLEATFDGYLAAVPAGLAGRPVAAFFTAGTSPVSVPVVIPLAAGRGGPPGAVTLVGIGSGGGTLQLLLDVSAYLD